MSTATPNVAEGLVLAPFRGVRFDPGRVSDLAAVTSPPYDVIEPDGVRLLETLDPHNIVRLILPREDACGSEGRYRHAARLLRDWLSAGVLRTDPTPGLYVYEQVTPSTVQRGLVGALGLRNPREGVVLPHEDVMPGPVADRLELMRATETNPDPILLMYGGGGAASDIVEQACEDPAILTARMPDGISHRLWKITDQRLLAAVGQDLVDRKAMIADGHHRYAAYRRLEAEHYAAGDGFGPWSYGLAMLVDSVRHPLEIRAIHRVLPKLRGEDAIDALRAVCQVIELDRQGAVDDNTMAADLSILESGEAAAGPAFLLVAAGRRWIATRIAPALLASSIPTDQPPVWRELDAAVLHHALIENVWHQPDDPEHVTYHHDGTEAIAAAERTGGIAVLLRPPPIETVVELAAAGHRMPRKSTSFGPKPRTGILLRSLSV
ncbi:MAG TPA: DUF1015 domain-containing protein [Actinomycetes bacterium]|nr:DUF1015 domain-containing protein [Actinomycetes bacterium]